MTRLGLLGGTFDPPHYGHLAAAQEAHWQLGLQRVLFLPARQNPLKRGEGSSDSRTRCEMVRLAIDGDDRFELSELDLAGAGPSYTVDLLRLLARPDRELYFLAGADILAELPRWHAPLEILQLATLVIATRPGTPAPNLQLIEQQLPGAAGRIRVLDIPGVDIASRDLRARVRAGQPIRYLTPPAVERYIAEERLYQG